MYGDFSRTVLSAPETYRRVLMQQGRVLLDADYNDQVAILLGGQEALTMALLGGYGTTDDGFQVSFELDEAGKLKLNDQGRPTLKLAPGHYSVHGMLCARERCTQAVAFPAGFETRRFFLYLEAWERGLSAIEDPQGDFREPALDGVDTTLRTRVECRVRLIDEQSAPELFGPIVAKDTNARREELERLADVSLPTLPEPQLAGASAAWRWLAVAVGALPIVGLLAALLRGASPGAWEIAATGAMLAAAALLFMLHYLPSAIARSQAEERELTRQFLGVVAANFGELVRRGARLMTEPLRQQEVTRLFQASFEKVVSAQRTVAQITLSDSRAPNQSPPIYRGSHSQLYRVEIHYADQEGAWFKWSRDNGARLFRAQLQEGEAQAPAATIAIAARQAESEALNGCWVELLPDGAAGEAAPQLRRVTDVEWSWESRTAVLTLDHPAATARYVRAWDHDLDGSKLSPDLTSYGAIPVSAGRYELEDGLEISFSDPEAAYQAGDYWLIKVRPDQPLIVEASAPCRQLRRAPLARVTFRAEAAPEVIDCRVVVRSPGRLALAAVDALESEPSPAAKE